MLQLIEHNTPTVKPQIWMPKRVVFTPAALEESYGQKIYQRISALGLDIETLPSNRVTGLRGKDARETYRIAKRTLAVVTAPPSAFKLRPTPPSADWQFHLAEGCPAHCQYCYLAGSLTGPPAIRVFANLPDILQNLTRYAPPGETTTFEASCYTDPLGIEHLTGSLAECISFFGQQSQMRLRWVTKYDHVEQLLHLPHQSHTRCRISLNAVPVVQRLEGGTASLPARLQALRQLALPPESGGGGYPIGVVLAPIMPVPDWKRHYAMLLDQLQETLDFPCDLTFELISHRFTPGAKDTLLQWYPGTTLEMEEAGRATKYNKFGGKKYIYPPEMMYDLRSFFEKEIAQRFSAASILYFT